MDDRKMGARVTMRWSLLAFLLILALGGFLRLKDLGEESLWNDELESWRQSSFDSLEEVISKGVRPDTHPPGFQVVLFVVENTLGATEADLRLPSAVSGILSIVVIYALGKRHLSDTSGLLAALFMAVMWAPIHYSQEARNYALVLLLTLMAGHFWMEMVQRIERAGRLHPPLVVSYIVTAAAAAYSHYFGLLATGLQAVFLLLQVMGRRCYVRTVLAAYLAIGLLYSPWIPSMVEQLSHTERISWIQPPSVTAFPAFISFAFSRLRPLGLLAILGYGWLLWSTLKERRRNRGLPVRSLLTSPEGLLFYWLLAPLVLTYILSVLWTPIFTQRNLLVCLPAAYLLLARALERLPLPPIGRWGLGVAVSAVALYELVFAMGYYRYVQKEQFREAVGYVIERHGATQGPLIIGYSRFPEYFDYYFARLNSNLRIELTAGENEDIARLNARLETEKPLRIWFLSAHRTPDDGFLEALQEDYDLLDQRGFFMAEARLLGRAER